MLNRISSLAGQLVNFYKRYRFDSDLMPIDLSALLTPLTGLDGNLRHNTA